MLAPEKSALNPEKLFLIHNIVFKTRVADPHSFHPDPDPDPAF
jgi:hypothetical protein